MKQRLLTLALAALTTASVWALNPPSYFIIDKDKLQAGIHYPSTKYWYEEDDTETTEIRVPETFTHTDGNVYTVIVVEGGFEFYKNLQKAYIPKTIQKICMNNAWGPNLYPFLNYVEEIEIDPANEYFTLENNIVYSKDKTIVYGTPYKNNNIHTVNIPEGVEYICSYSFSYLPISSVTLPKSLIAIGEHAFRATNLKEVTLPDNLKFIGNDPFTSPLQENSSDYEYRVEIKNIPSTLIFDKLRAQFNLTSVCYSDQIYINPGHTATSVFSANPKAFPNLKSIVKDGFHSNTMAYTLVDYGRKYVAAGLESPSIYANDSVISSCKTEIKRAEENGYPFSVIPELVSTGPMTPLIPGSERENLKKLDDIIIGIANTNSWIRTGFQTPLALYSNFLNNSIAIATDETDFYYPACKLIESTENPGQYFIRCNDQNCYWGEYSKWEPQSSQLIPCRLYTFYDATPALFTISDNGDGTCSITDTEGHPLCPGYDSYVILRGKADFERYNRNLELKSELNSVVNEASVLCQTEAIYPYLVDSPDQLRSEHSEPKEGSFANLFDDNINTFWHSAWSTSLGIPRHDLDMIFADGQTARNIIIDYAQRPYTGSKLKNARVHWSTDGGNTFSSDYVEFNSSNGLNDDKGELPVELNEDVNALRLSGTGDGVAYWALGELRVRDANAEPSVIYSEDGRLALAIALSEVDYSAISGDFAKTIAELRALMESIKNGTYGSIETPTDELTETAVEWFNLQGMKVAHPTPGKIYIRRAGSRTTKVRL